MPKNEPLKANECTSPKQAIEFAISARTANSVVQGRKWWAGMVDKPLKVQNTLRLSTVLLANAAVFYGISYFGSVSVHDWTTINGSWANLLPIGGIAILVSVLNAQIGALTKARLVFMRWHDPMPGSGAFTRLGPKDPRVDMSAIKRRLKSLPTAPERQNAIWYGMYKEVRTEPAVTEANREYLFARDYHVFSALILIGFGITSIWTIDNFSTRLWYSVGLFLQFLLTGNAARNHGNRLVCTVLAMCAKPNKTGAS